MFTCPLLFAWVGDSSGRGGVQTNPDEDWSVLPSKYPRLERFYSEKKTWGAAQWGHCWEAGVGDTSIVLIHRKTDPEASGQLQKVRSGNRKDVEESRMDGGGKEDGEKSLLKVKRP